MARKYALFVGNSQYNSQSLNDLESPITDVRDLAEVFRDAAIGGFDEVCELINSPEAEIRQAISSFYLHKKPDDLLLLYFSGHGILDDKGRLYLAVKDTQPDLLKATSISADFIADDMDSCRSKRQILILDCCHSGAFRQGIKGGDKVLNATTFEGNGSGRIILTASDRRGYAMEGNKVLEEAQSSLFTHYLLEGIVSGEADRDGDCYISLDEWYDYAYDKVVSKLPTQTPRRWVYNQEGKLIIARNPQPDKIKAPALPRSLQASLEDARPTVRLRATTELAEILNGADKRLALVAREALENMLEDESAKVTEAAKEILAGYKSGISEVGDAQNAVQESGSTAIVDQPTKEGRATGSISDEGNSLVLNWMGNFERIKQQWKLWAIPVTIALFTTLIIIATQLYPGFFTTSQEPGGGDYSSTGQTDLSNNNLATLNNNPTPLVDDSSSQEQRDAGGQDSRPNRSDESPNEEQDHLQNDPSNPSGQDSELHTNPPPEEEGATDSSNPLSQIRVTGTTISNNELENTTPKSAETQDRNLEDSTSFTGKEERQISSEQSIDRVHAEISALQNILTEAIMRQDWSSLPQPVADYYGNLLKDFYARFNVIEVVSSAGDLQTDGATASLPVAVDISYRQKGRDNVHSLNLPAAHWVWVKREQGFELSFVQPPE